MYIVTYYLFINIFSVVNSKCVLSEVRIQNWILIAVNIHHVNFTMLVHILGGTSGTKKQ